MSPDLSMYSRDLRGSTPSSLLRDRPRLDRDQSGSENSNRLVLKINKLLQFVCKFGQLVDNSNIIAYLARRLSNAFFRNPV